MLYAPPHEWTMQRIGEALKCSVSTVHAALRKDAPGEAIFSTPEKIKPAAKTNKNPKGAGRPQGSQKTKLAPERRKNTSVQAELAASMVLDQGKTYPEVEAATGFSNTVVRSAVAREEGRREAKAEPDADRALRESGAAGRQRTSG